MTHEYAKRRFSLSCFFHAEQQRLHNHRNLVDIRNLAAQLLDNLVKADLIASSREPSANTWTLSRGVSAQYSFIGGISMTLTSLECLSCC